VAGTLQQLLLPLAHLDRVHRMLRDDLLEDLAATDRFHGDLSQMGEEPAPLPPPH
jgi:hypothetical protein